MTLLTPSGVGGGGFVDDNAAMLAFHFSSDSRTLAVRCVIFTFVAVSSSSCGLLSNAECAADGDCHGSKVCFEGACVECKGDSDCGARESCVANTCERGVGEGEGEGSAGEGEGEGGEGEGGVGEGEGGFGEGEGEGGFGEGEGEGGVGDPQLSFTLAWSLSGTDVDVHATQGSPFCIDPTTVGFGATTTTFGPFSQSCTTAPLDCNYTNCTVTSGTRPDWDGVASGTGDPVLEHDSVDGSTPELIDVQAPAVGEYLVGTDYFGSHSHVGANTVTLTVRDHGAVAKTITTTVATEGEWHDLALVHVIAPGVFCIADVTDGVDECL